jgi:hypothetical protein
MQSDTIGTALARPRSIKGIQHEHQSRSSNLSFEYQSEVMFIDDDSRAVRAAPANFSAGIQSWHLVDFAIL